MSLFRDKNIVCYLLEMTILMIITIGAAITKYSVIVILCAIIMWILSIYYLLKRERLYNECTEIVERFEDGDFSVHLPKNKEGSFYALLSRIDRLALTLESKNETEKESRELINNRISDISHQLKTPLAALLMYNEIMEDEIENEKVIKDFNEKSKKSLLRMQQLIQTLLVMTRLDSGSIVFEKEKYYTCEIVKESVRDLRIRAENENKEITLKGNECDTIFCDKKWTMEAISNIVKNALDNTKSNGKINISWTAQGGVTRIVIQDNGSGIKSEDICHIFKRFYRSSENKSAGIGLGLPLAKSIIEEQGGAILLNSIYGEGTTMTLSFL